MNTRILLGLTLSFAIGAVAQAATPSVSDSDAPSVVVRMSDLDLSRTEGAKALLARLRHAASMVCGGRPSSPLDLAGWQAYDACVHQSLDGAVGQVRAPLVATLYRGRAETVAAVGGPG